MKSLKRPGIENLKPVQPGEVRNPTGKNGLAGGSVKRILREMLATPPDKFEKANLPPFIRYMIENKLGRDLSRAEIMSMMVMRKAMDGDLAAFNTIVDRVEGRPVQKNENANVNINYVEFLKMKKEELENESETEETEVFQRQEAGHEGSFGD